MQLFCISVKDRAADIFNRPFYVPHRNVAIRDFTDEVNRADPQNALSKHPDDYDLYLLCVYDDSTGVHASGSPELLVRGKDVVQPA